MKITSKLTHGIIAIFFSIFASMAGAEVHYIKNIVTVSGKIDADTYSKLSDFILSEPVSTILFKDSGGGSFSVGLKIGKFISERKIKTIAEGICASACAIAFLGGDVREFSSVQHDSALMFHPGFERTSQIPAEETKAVFFEWIEARTKHPFAADFVAAMNKITQRKGGVYFLSPAHGIALRENASVFFCDGSEKNISNCAGQRDTSSEKMYITSAIESD